MKLNYRSKGFTIIEILIVIAIMAIIASAILPNFIGLDKSAPVATTLSNLGSLRTAINMYRSQVGSYPTGLSLLTSTSYDDAGATVYYLNQVPVELISSSSGHSAEYTTMTAAGSGWFYTSASPVVRVNYSNSIDSTWGSAYSGNVPGSW